MLEHKIFATLGLVTIVSGLYLTYVGTYIPGIGGTVVGIWLTVENLKKIKDRSDDVK